MNNETENNEHPIPERGTTAALAYFWASTADDRLFQFVIDTALRGDFVAYVAKSALDGKSDYKTMDPVTLAKSEPGPRTTALRQSSQELLEMFLSRAVDNFQAYIVDIVRSVLHKQPRILSARKQELSLGYILQFDSIEALTRDIIEGRVAALSYEGFGELEEWCQSRGIPLLVPQGKRDQVVELIATRNLIVHNRGIVDERYRKAVASSKYSVGQQRDLEVDTFLSALELLNTVVRVTDSAIAGKFGLDQVNLRKEIRARAEQRWPRPSKKQLPSPKEITEPLPTVSESADGIQEPDASVAVQESKGKESAPP